MVQFEVPAWSMKIWSMVKDRILAGSQVHSFFFLTVHVYSLISENQTKAILLVFLAPELKRELCGRTTSL